METKRQLQVAEVIKRNFGRVLQDEGSYIYGNTLVTVTKVTMSPDLSQAKIYLSVYNTDDKESVIYMIESSLHHLKQALAHRIRKHVRRIPELFIYEDDTLDEMYKLNKIFDKISDEDKNND